MLTIKNIYRIVYTALAVLYTKHNIIFKYSLVIVSSHTLSCFQYFIHW